MNIQNWFPLWLTGLISLQSKRLSRISSAITVQTSILPCSALFMVQLSRPYMTTGETIALTIQTFVSNVMSLLFNMLSKFVIVFFFFFLPSSECLLISWLQSPSAGIYPQDGGVEGHTLSFSCENTQIATCCWTTIYRRMLAPTK